MSAGDQTAARRLVTFGGLLLFGVLLLRTAWVDDDAYITFRTVDNLLNGYGPRWNVANRVQSFTHPLWMLTMTAATAVVRDVFYGSILLSMSISLVAIGLVASRIAASPSAAVLALSVFGLSKAFVDYSTSGLENPMTHLLLAAFFTVHLTLWPDPRKIRYLALLASLLMLNRLDTGLLVLPALALDVWRLGPRRGWSAVAVGLLPLAAWEAFSLVYYGFPFPNTAYSKIATGVPRGEVIGQGLLYLLDSLNNDPITLLVIAAALLSPIAGVRGWAIPAGVGLYLGYVVWVGGDFMSGRFLTAPLLCAVMQLARAGVAQGNPQWAAAMAIVWVVGLSAPRPTLLSNASYGSDVDPMRLMAASGIMDERRYYFPQAGLLNARRGAPMPNHKWLFMGFDDRARGRKVVYTDAAGYIGYAAGPSVHYIDRYGLGDPLLARLPADAPWRMGHFVRRIPDGYLESIESGRNMIRDPGVAAFYERLRVITEGPLFTRERLRTIVSMNLGRYARWVAGYGLVRAHLWELSAAPADGAAWNAAGARTLTHRGALIAVADGDATAAALEISVSGDDRYRVRLRRAGEVQHDTRIAPRMIPGGALTTHVVDIPPDVRFDAIEILPSHGDGQYSVGHVRLLSSR